MKSFRDVKYVKLWQDETFVLISNIHDTLKKQRYLKKIIQLCAILSKVSHLLSAKKVTFFVQHLWNFLRVKSRKRLIKSEESISRSTEIHVNITKNPSFCLKKSLKNSKNRRNSSRGGYSQFLRVLKPVCFDHEFAFFTPHLLRGEETIRALKRGRRGSNGCSATGSRSTNNLVNEGWLLGPIGSRFLGRSGWCAGLRLALGCVSRAHPASIRACALSPPPRARLVANAFLSRAKSAPLTRAPSPFLSFRDNFLLLSGLNVSLLDNHVTSLPFLSFQFYFSSRLIDIGILSLEEIRSF